MPTVHFYCVFCGSTLQTPSESRPDVLKCHCCSQYVPVPKPANEAKNFTSYPSVLPPEVLDLLVKFKCSACDSILYADARYEGRDVVCSGCGVHTRIPVWSNVPTWPRFSEAGEIARMRAKGAPTRAEAPKLSIEEIDFLRGTESRKPEAAA